MKKKLTIIYSILIIAILSFWIYEYRDNLPRARIVSCSSNLKQIQLALQMYASENNGYFPLDDGAKGLELLRNLEILENPKMYQCVFKSHRKEVDRYRSVLGLEILLPVEKEFSPPLTEDFVNFHYRGGLKTTSPKELAIAWDKENNHDKYGYILFVDGHVEGFAGANWIDNIKK